MILTSGNNQGLRASFRMFLTLALFVTLGIFVSHRSLAASPWDFLASLSSGGAAICNPTQAMFAHIAEDQPQQSIVRFAYNYDTTRYLKLFYNMFGMSIDNAIRCITKLPGVPSLSGTLCTVFTGAPANPEVCNDMLIGIPGVTDASTEGRMAFSNSPVSGSLIGLYHQVDAAQRYADPPPNLAFFASQEFKHVPFVGKALAQSDTAFRGFFITKVYFAWKFVRNIAFGLMALVMIVIGVMMINRTKVNSQTIVTIQYALPKVIIASILIAFSYPIAATLTNFFFILSLKAPAIVTSTILTDVKAELAGVDLSSFITSTGSFNFVTLILYVLASAFQITVMGPVLFIVWAICDIIIIVQMIIIMVKWLLTYVKMLVEIVLSPIDLFLSAMPGSEEKGSGESKVVKWFKKFLAYGLSMIILTAMPVLVLWIGATIIIAGMLHPAATPALSGIGVQVPLPSVTSLATMGAGFDITIFFLVVVMGFSMTSKLPGQIQYMLMGKAPESRK